MDGNLSIREDRHRPKVWERIAKRIYGNVRLHSHLGLIFYRDLSSINDIGDPGHDVALSADVGEISAFYERVGRTGAG